MAGFRDKYSQLHETTENLLFAIIMLFLVYRNLECLHLAPSVLPVPLIFSSLSYLEQLRVYSTKIHWYQHSFSFPLLYLLDTHYLWLRLL